MADHIRPYYKDKEKTICIESVDSMQTLDGCNYFKDTQNLIAQNCINLYSLSGTEKLIHCLQVNISFTPIRSLQNFKNFKKLQKLIANNTQLDSLKGVENCYAMLELDISNCYFSNMQELDTLKNFRRLRLLNISGNPFSNKEQFESLLFKNLPCSLEILNGQQLTEEQRQKISEINNPKVVVHQTFELPKDQLYSQQFQQEIKQFFQENQNQLSFIGYLSKLIKFTSVSSYQQEQAKHNIPSDFITYDNGNVIEFFSQNKFKIDNQLLYLQEQDVRKIVYLQNPSNQYIQKCFVYPCRFRYNDILIIGQLNKHKPVNIEELFSRLSQLYERQNNYRFQNYTLSFRRQISQYSVQILVFIPKPLEVDIYQTHPLQHVQQLAKFSKLINQKISYFLAIEDFQQDFLDLELFEQFNILNELDTEIVPFFEPKQKLCVYIVENGCVIDQTDNIKLAISKLCEICHIDSQDVEIDEKDVFCKHRTQEKEDKDYVYEYDYVDEEECENDTSAEKINSYEVVSEIQPQPIVLDEIVQEKTVEVDSKQTTQQDKGKSAKTSRPPSKTSAIASQKVSRPASKIVESSQPKTSRPPSSKPSAQPTTSRPASKTQVSNSSKTQVTKSRPDSSKVVGPPKSRPDSSKKSTDQKFAYAD